VRVVCLAHRTYRIFFSRGTKFGRVGGGGEVVICRAGIDVVRSPARSPALKRDCSELSIAERAASNVAL